MTLARLSKRGVNDLNLDRDIPSAIAKRLKRSKTAKRLVK